jgi:hypothetical protein
MEKLRILYIELNNTQLLLIQSSIHWHCFIPYQYIIFFTFIVVPIEANKLYFQNTITINKPYIPLMI